jgi:hypothetical protein
MIACHEANRDAQSLHMQDWPCAATARLASAAIAASRHQQCTSLRPVRATSHRLSWRQSGQVEAATLGFIPQY